MTKIQFSDEERVIQSLQQRRYVQNADIFAQPQSTNTDFWRLSDLSIVYPTVFDVRHPVSTSTINKMDTSITANIPKFKDLSEKPIHVLDVKETFNAYFPETNTIKTIKNGTNQLLSRLACEYIFRYKDGFYLEQAYFMSPNQSPEDIKELAEKIKFEQIRSHAANNSKILSAIINRAYGARPYSFSQVWSAFWCAFYGVNSFDDLKNRYNLKSTPLNYMQVQTFNFVISRLQEMAAKFYKTQYYSINEVITMAHDMGLFARAKFIRYGKRPEDELQCDNSYKIIRNVREYRKKFQEQYYPLSLQQR